MIFTQGSDGRMVYNQPRTPTILSTTGEFSMLLLTVIWELLVSLYRVVIPKSMKSVKNEIVLVTGAGHGIGQELALKYASEGAVVVCVDLREQANRDTSDKIINLGYELPHCYTCDVTNRTQVNETVKKILAEVGDITILINNAGILIAKPFLEQTQDDIENTMKINVMAHFWTLQAIIPVMLKNNKGHIVALSSVCGLSGSANLVPYAASKYGVRGIMDALLRELYRKPNCQIKFTTIFPLIIDTGLCKTYNVRFPLLTPVVSPSQAAFAIMRAQRTNIQEVTIPGNIYNTLSWLQLLPFNAYTKGHQLFDYRVGRA